RERGARTVGPRGGGRGRLARCGPASRRPDAGGGGSHRATRRGMRRAVEPVQDSRARQRRNPAGGGRPQGGGARHHARGDDGDPAPLRRDRPGGRRGRGGAAGLLHRRAGRPRPPPIRRILTVVCPRRKGARHGWLIYGKLRGHWREGTLMTARSFEATAHRSDGWWALEVTGDGLPHPVYTQARRLDQAEDMVRDLLALPFGHGSKDVGQVEIVP